MDILIIYGYHPKEIFAVRVGEYFLEHNSNPGIEVAKYDGKRDNGRSTFCLRKFVEKFKPAISPIILHDDSVFGHLYGAIVYSAKSKRERRRAAKRLMDFILEENSLIAFGTFLTPGTNYNLFDIEFNPRAISVEKAGNLIERFAEYLIDLRSRRKINL